MNEARSRKVPWIWNEAISLSVPLPVNETPKVSTMIVVMRVVGFANGSDCPVENHYLQSFDHEACDGVGYGVFTSSLDKAMRFDDMKAAIQFWQKIPACRPLRDDGKPNRPMTATTMEFLRLDKITPTTGDPEMSDPQTKISYFKILNEYLDQDGTHLYDVKSIKMQIDALKEMELKCLATLMASCKKSFQDLVKDDNVISDIFIQSTKLVQLINQQINLLSIIALTHHLIDDPKKKRSCSLSCV